MKVPLLVHRLGDQLQISEITGNDLMNVGGRAADGGELTASAVAVTEALQALYIRSSCHEQQLNNLQLAHHASHSELKNFTDSKKQSLEQQYPGYTGYHCWWFCSSEQRGPIVHIE